MTIRLILRVVFGFTVAAAAILLLITLLLKTSLEASEEAANKRFELTNLAEMADNNSARLTRLARQYVITLNPEFLNEYDTLVRQIKGEVAWPDGRKIAYLDWLEGAGVVSDDLAILEKSTQRSLNLVKTEVRAFDLVKPLAGKRVENLTEPQHAQRNQAVDLLFNQSYQDNKATIAAPVDEFIEIINNKSLQGVVESRNKVGTLSSISLGLVVLIIIILVLCYLKLESRVIKTTKNLVFEAKRIASGDLSHKIEFTGNDEISQLSQSFNIMVERLSDLLREIATQAEYAQSSSQELDQIAQGARELNDVQNEAIEIISSSVYENSVAVKEVAKNCVDAAESAEHVERQTTEGGLVVREGIASVQSVASVMSESIARLADLEKSVADVTAILNVISNIAEQTNLLALNAAIEAARAGEQGRGFAVVADEVRTLASRTQTSTIEIKEKINALQSVSQSVTQSIHSSDESVKQAVHNSERIGEMLQSITALAKGILDMNQSIAAASEEQSKVTDDIAERLVSIRDASAQSKEQAGELSQSSGELSRVALTLTDQVKQFVLP